MKVAVVGLGYVGLSLAVEFAKKGIGVLGVEVDIKKLGSILSGVSYVDTVSDKDLLQAKQEGFYATADFSQVTQAAAIILCVQTPIDIHEQPQLSFIESALDSLLPHMKKGQLLCLESTTYPGTTEEFILPKLTEALGSVGRDFFLAYSPERVNPGGETSEPIPKLVGGVTGVCTRTAAAMYWELFPEVVPVSSPRVAEMAKLMENTYRSVNIALANEMKMACDVMGVDPREVVEAAATKPFGYQPFYPGPGVGGHCISVDSHYLSWKMKEYGLNMNLINQASQVNNLMPSWVVGKVIGALKHTPICRANIIVYGISYKKNVRDVRRSPSLEIIRLLDAMGANVIYVDPIADDVEIEEASKIPGNDLQVSSADCVVICTAHDCIDYGKLEEIAKVIVDTRGVISKDCPKLVSA